MTTAKAGQSWLTHPITPYSLGRNAGSSIGEQLLMWVTDQRLRRRRKNASKKLFVRNLVQTSAEPSLLEFCRVQPRLSKDHARGPEVLAAWSTQSRTKVPHRGTFSSKQLVFSWLKFLCEALCRSSLRTKLRASSMHLHGLLCCNPNK